METTQMLQHSYCCRDVSFQTSSSTPWHFLLCPSPSLPLFMLINHAGGLLFRSLIGGCIKVVNCRPVVDLRTVWWARGRWCMQAQLDQTVTLGRNAAELGCLWRISELVGCHAPGAAPMAISRLRVSHDALNIRHYTTNLELVIARSKNS